MRSKFEPRKIEVILLAFSWLVRLYPRDFRRLYAQEMQLTFCDLCTARLAEDGFFGLATEFFHSVADLSLEISKAHMQVAINYGGMKLTELAGLALVFAGAAYVSPICMPVAEGEENAPY